MARQQTRKKVHEAVLSLAHETPAGTITMEGIAARAGVSKQTLYRTWPSTGAILFDALLARSMTEDGTVEVPNSGDLAADLELLATATIAELTDTTHEPMLRAITAQMQSDDGLAAQFRERLLTPQLAGISDRFRRENVPDPYGIAELFVGPIFHRWLLRTHPFDSEWVTAHVARTLRAAAFK
ncbi:TetR family transcriptional regulator [Rhodoglobus vestalii]|uniref:TetR family transcriptional regulator n=1 Tax=Rhodoglobus vestalii TaxID=193384 RepID=A0A8H2K4C0_9MICO|nr:TetR/AcrR family transcriptional regulator [Rhodoglobus vestalii]TQO19905.1 TetR family transcriptional regulator [Rhodoglobus vestalii]